MIEDSQLLVFSRMLSASQPLVPVKKMNSELLQNVFWLVFFFFPGGGEGDQ